MKRLKRKKLDIPTKVRGRVVSNRGVHLQPFGYHGFWLDREMEDAYWTDLLTSMGISWVVILTEDDSVLEERHGTTPLKVLLDHGIIPIIRDKQHFPEGFANIETVRRTVDLYARYGLRPFWQLYNEPFDPREWKDQQVPAYDEAWEIIVARWTEGARQVAEAGAYVGFPDGPCYAENPFERLRPVDGLELFDMGMAYYAPHNYGLGRPLWYPYDAVTRHGAELTEIAYRRLLDDYADYPNWHDAPIETINQQRQEWAEPTRTAKTDDTCWRGWEKTVAWAVESLSYVPPMAMTEGGWTPRARAGVVPVDNRWSYATPKMVAKKTVQMYDTPSPLFAICPWLLATSDMGGTGWFDDAWHGGAFSDKYGRQKPVIDVLKETPPKEIEARSEPMVIDVDGDTRDWRWVGQVYGASYRRYAPSEPADTDPELEEAPSPLLRLIEVHEYEGPRTLDVRVVDGDGLPVEGVEFYYHQAAEPPSDPDGTGDHPAYESHDRTILEATDAEGHISFPVTGLPRAPIVRPGTVWPKDRGDVLEHLGLLPNTNHRHLNSVWQWVDPSALDPGETDTGSGHPTDPVSGGGTGGGSLPQWAMEVDHRPGARIIAGSLPQAGIDVTVTDPWGNATTVTSGAKLDHGPGGFEVVAPHIATYTLAFLDQAFEVETHDGATFVTLTSTAPPDSETEPGTDPDDGGEPEPDPPAGWAMEVDHRPGARIIAGSLPQAGIDVTVTDPWGNATTVTSGAKLDHGPGGFEVVAPHIAAYTLAFLDQAFEVETHDGATFVTLTTTAPPDSETEPGTDPDDGGEPEPDPPAGWAMEVDHRPGARIIAGSLPQAGIDVTVTDPWGNATTVTSGAKLDHGPGGFEVVAPHIATYTLAFLDQAFEVETHDGATFVILTHEGEPDSGSGPGSETGTGPVTEGTAGGNKLGFYCEVTTTPGLMEAIRDVQPPTLLTHANDRGLLQAMRRHLAPDTFVVGRLYVERQVQDGWLRSIDPEAIGRAFAEAVLSHDFGMATERGENGRLLIDAWMTLNECLPGPASQAYREGTAAEREAIERKADAYDRFQVAFRNRLKEADHELEAVALNFGAGNFPDAASYLDWFPRTLASYVYLGFHEYGWPALSKEIHPEAASSAGTYRDIMQGIRQRHGARHQVIITEAGLARLFKHIEFPPGDVGWLYPGETISQDSYWRSLDWYNDLLWEDDYVVGVCLFEVGHGGEKWETFRHLGLDNEGRPLQIIPWIRTIRERRAITDLMPSGADADEMEEVERTVALRGRVICREEPVEAVKVRLLGSADILGSDPRAALYKPGAVTWTKAITGFDGTAWNCWQRFVARHVAGITWDEFKGQIVEYNPTLRETGGRLEARRTYYLPENKPSLQPGIIWDRSMHGFYGHRWACWKTFVRTKVIGMTWEVFKEEVVARNPHLADDRLHFVASKSYLLPRNVGQDLYMRVGLTNAKGEYEIRKLPSGSYGLEIATMGYRPLRRPLQLPTDMTLDLQIERIEFG